MGNRSSARPVYTNEENDTSDYTVVMGGDDDEVDEDEMNEVDGETSRGTSGMFSPAKGRFSASGNPNKRPPSVLEMWKEMADSTATVEKERNTLEKSKLEIENKRLRLEEKRADLEMEKAKWEIMRSRFGLHFPLRQLLGLGCLLLEKSTHLE